jgi:hypothetical protein
MVPRRCYRQIFGPRHHVAKFTDARCPHADPWVYFHPHLGRQATQSYVESGAAFGLVSHVSLPPLEYRQLGLKEVSLQLLDAASAPTSPTISRSSWRWALATGLKSLGSPHAAFRPNLLFPRQLMVYSSATQIFPSSTRVGKTLSGV